jgi:hypothetical protein
MEAIEKKGRASEAAEPIGTVEWYFAAKLC